MGQVDHGEAQVEESGPEQEVAGGDGLAGNEDLPQGKQEEGHAEHHPGPAPAARQLQPIAPPADQRVRHHVQQARERNRAAHRGQGHAEVVGVEGWDEEHHGERAYRRDHRRQRVGGETQLTEALLLHGSGDDPFDADQMVEGGEDLARHEAGLPLLCLEDDVHLA